jgi:hypothetical protein
MINMVPATKIIVDDIQKKALESVTAFVPN